MLHPDEQIQISGITLNVYTTDLSVWISELSVWLSYCLTEVFLSHCHQVHTYRG